jgi:hypothetical protein
MTWNVLHASPVASGRWSNRGGGLLDIFCECLRDSFGAVPFSEIGALPAADFASSAGDMLGPRERALGPSGVAESLVSSLFNLTPFVFGRSSSPNPVTASEARLLSSMATNQTVRARRELADQNLRGEARACSRTQGL